MYQLKKIKFLQTNHKKYLSTLIGCNLWSPENQSFTLDMKLKIEQHWKEKLGQFKKSNANNSQNKYYVLSMFPYPSGKLHMGHVRVYTISDTLARYYEMNGKNIIHPMGWDAFGLPAENASIDKNIPPDKWTIDNISHMKLQLKQLGCKFDWSRELATCSPDYYKWTQYIFIKLFENNLVYQKSSLVNWDPIDKTVLADEQVDENGCSWRSGAKIEKRPLKQWFIRTTKFAKSLYDGLKDPILDQWKDIVKKHWLGECNGVGFDFKVKELNDEIITVWTKHPEYIDQASFIGVSSRSYLALLQNDKNSFDNLKAINLFNNKQLPIFITDELEYEEKSDCHLGLPMINECDYAFAKKHNLNIDDMRSVNLTDPLELLQLQNGICERAKQLNVGGYWMSSKIRDWLISRQRYWGTPIPIIHCKKCGSQPVNIEDLPVELPKLESTQQKGSMVLENIKDWVWTKCPKCDSVAKRETDTMDTFVDSAWYYLRFLDSSNQHEPFDKETIEKLAPVDLYIGGKEHATLHLYYARFLHHFLHSINLVPEREPFKRLLVQGMVMGKTYRVKSTGQYLIEQQVEIVNEKKKQAKKIPTGEPVVISWEKMSKSKLNGVDPDEMFKKYSVDTIRLLILADVAPTSHRNWNTATFPGILNWQNRLWLTVQQFINYRNNLPKLEDDEIFKEQESKLNDSRNYYVKGVNFNYHSSQQLSVAISKMQGLTNSIRQSKPHVIAHGPYYQRALATLILLLSPMAPHFALELWSGFISAPNCLPQIKDEFDWSKSVLEQKWPEVDLEYNCDILFKVNGSEVTSVKMPRRDLDELTLDKVWYLSLEQNKLKTYLNNRKVKHVVFKLNKAYRADVDLITFDRTQKADDNIVIKNVDEL